MIMFDDNFRLMIVFFMSLSDKITNPRPQANISAYIHKIT